MTVNYLVPVVDHFYWQPAVKSRTLSSPPTGSVKSDRYIVGPSPSGAWSGKQDYITQYTGSLWQFFQPTSGWQVWVSAENAYYYYTTAWSRISPFTTKVRAYQTVAQAPASGVWTKINLQAVSFDVLGEFSTGSSRFTAAVAGYYKVQAQLSFTSNRQVTVGIYINGVIFTSMRGNAVFAALTSDLIYLNVGDYVEFYCNSNGGATVNSSTSTYLSINRVL